MPDDPVFGSLYRPERGSLANSGQPIQLNQTGDQMEHRRRDAVYDLQHRR